MPRAVGGGRPTPARAIYEIQKQAFDNEFPGGHNPVRDRLTRAERHERISRAIAGD